MGCKLVLFFELATSTEQVICESACFLLFSCLLGTTLVTRACSCVLLIWPLKTELGCPLAPSAPPGVQVTVDTCSASLCLSLKNNVLLTATPQVLQVDHTGVFWLGVVAAPGGVDPVMTGTIPSTKARPGVVQM